MSSGVTNFTSLVEARSLGTGDIDKMTAAIDKQSASLDKLAERAKKVNDHPGFDELAGKIKSGIEDPLNAAGEAAESMLKKLGPEGAAAAAGAGIIASVGFAALEAAKGLAEYGRQIANAELRTGMGAKEVAQFGFAAKAAGQDISSVERMMRGLTQAVEDQSSKGERGREWLRKFGIDIGGVRTGTVSTATVLMQLADGLEKMPNAFERNAAGIDIFKRAWLDVSPVLLELKENLKFGEENGIGASLNEGTIARYKELERQIALIDSKWGAFKRSVQEGLVIEVQWAGDAIGWMLRHLAADSRISPFDGTGGAPVPDDLIDDVKTANRMKGKWGNRPPTYDSIQGLYQQRMMALQDIRPSDLANPDAKTQRALDWAAQYQYQIEHMQKQLAAEVAKRQDEEAAAARKEAGRLGAIYFGDHSVLEKAFETAKQDVLQYQERLADLRDSKSPKMDDVRKAGQDLAGAVQREAAAKAALDRQAEAKKWETEREAFHKRATEVEMTEGQKILDQRDRLIAQGQQLKKSELELAQIRQDAAAALDRLLAKSMLEFAGEEEKRQSAVVKERIKLSWPGADQMREWSEGFRVDDEIRRIGIDSTRSASEARSRRAVQMSELRSSPGQERVSVEFGYLERLRLAREAADQDTEAARGLETAGARRIEYARIYATLSKDIRDADIEHELKLAELERQRMDQLRNRAGELFDGLLQGPKGIEQFLNNLVRGWGRTVFQNFLADELKNVNTHIFSGMGTTAEPTRLGKLLMGTPFGPDPMKAATELNTAVTVTNNQLLAELNARFLALQTPLSPSSGGGGIYTSSLAGLRDLNIDPWAGGDLSSLQTSANEAGMTQADPMSTVAAVRARTAQGLWGRAAGVAGVAAGAYGMYAGIEKGGTRGDLEAAGSGVAAVTSILALAGVASKSLGPAGIVAGMGLSFLTGLLGDPKQERAQAEQNTLWGSRYTPPTASNYTMDRYGSSYDTNMAGNLRPIIQVNIPVQALDAKSFSDQAGNLVNTISDALESKISPRLATALRNTVLTR